MPLRFLDFDCSDEGDGLVTFDAMATVAEADWPKLQAEVTRVLDWAHNGFAGVRGALDEDGDWDCDLHGFQEAVTPLTLDFDPPQGRLHCHLQPQVRQRFSLTLTLSGTAAFAQALRDRFGLGEPGA